MFPPPIFLSFFFINIVGCSFIFDMLSDLEPCPLPSTPVTRPRTELANNLISIVHSELRVKKKIGQRL